MQRLLLIILTSFFFMTSCKKSSPEGVLPEKTMVEMMTEVHLIDGYLSTLSIDSSRKVINSMYGHVFVKYKIDSIGFQHNLDYYLGNPTLAKKIYLVINENISAKDKEYRLTDSLKQAHITDSIRREQHYTKLRDDARELILNVQTDTVPLAYDSYHRDFLLNVGVNVIPQTVKPTPITKTPIKPSTENSGTQPVLKVPKKSSKRPAVIESESLPVEEGPSTTTNN